MLWLYMERRIHDKVNRGSEEQHVKGLPRGHDLLNAYDGQGEDHEGTERECSSCSVWSSVIPSSSHTWERGGILCWVQWSICNGKFQSWKRLYLEIPIFHFFGGPRHMACGIIVPWPGMEPKPLPLVARNFNHWPTGEVLPVFHS